MVGGLKPKLPTEPALVGREQQLEQLLQHLDLALNGRGTTVFVGGEAGVGKTRLVTEFLNHAKIKGTKVLSGWCLSEAALPYFPFTEAFNAYLSTISDDRMKKALTKHLGITGWLRGPEIIRESAEHLGITGWLRGPEIIRESKVRQLISTPEIERDRTFEATATAFLQLSTHEPTILVLEDLQWADHLSLALIHYVARKCRNSRLLIIGTYRSEELIRTKEEKLHPLEETMFSMSREDLLTKMDLGPLKRDDFPELLRSVFHSRFDDKFVEKLYRETEGNPLFVLETLNLLVEEGFLSESGEQWELTAPTEKIGVPSKVQEVIIRRISRLTREERKLLDHAAVCGHSFNLDTLRRTMSLDEIDVLEKLVVIEKRHKLIRSADSTFVFTHEKIREVIYDDLQGELRRAYHLKTASCLEQIPVEETSDGYLADIAFHYVEGGALEKAFEYLISLAEKAVELSANTEAIDYLNKALEATRTTASLASNENLARIYKIRGRAWLGRGMMANAKDDFNELLQNAISFGNESLLAESHYWLGEALMKQYNFDKAELNLLRAIEMARKTGNRFVECRSLASLGWSLVSGLDTLNECRMRLEESSKISKEIGDKVAYSRSHLWLAFFYNWRGEFNLARENVNEALSLFEELGDRFHVLHALMILGWINTGKGEYNDAISAIQRCLQLAQEWGIVYWDRAPMPLMQLGWIYRDLSSIELALQYDSEALENARLSAKAGMTKAGNAVAALVDLGADYLSRGDFENAEKHFKEAIPMVPLHRLATWRIHIHRLLGSAEIALAKGNFQNALKSVEDSLAMSEKAGSKKYIAKGLRLKGELLAKMGNLEEAIKLMGVALKVAKQVGNPPTLWQTHHSLGLLHEKRGDLQRAREHHAEAIALIEETAEKLDDVSLKNTLLNAPSTNAILEAYAKTKPASNA